MNTWVKLLYPVGFRLDKKELLLNPIELNTLMNSQKVGSEGEYFEIKERVFEDTLKDDGSVSYEVTIVLK